jgi:hypothetical protein
MKRILSAALLLSGLLVSAQSQRKVLYEEFTGENCPPCAATNPGLNALLLSATNATRVVAIKWQVPIPSAPSTTWSLYQTNKLEIDWRFLGWNGSTSSTILNGPSAQGYGYPSQNPSNITSGVNSAPSGRIDGQPQMVFGVSSNHPANLNNSHITTAHSFTSAFNVTMTRAYDATYSSINLTVNIQATANFNAVGPLVFRTVMVERLIQFPVAPGTNGEKTFEDVAVKSFPTLQAGTPMVSTWLLGQSQTFTMNCPIPSYVRDKSEIALVGFIQDDGNRKVEQTERADPVPVPNDAHAVDATVPVVSCANNLNPTVMVTNNGPNVITTMTITPYIDATPAPDNFWTGSLAPGASVTIVLNNITGITQGMHNFNYDVSGVGGTDYNTNNNKAGMKFMAVLAYGSTPIVEGFPTLPFPPANWAINATGSSWTRVTNVGGFVVPGQSAKLDLFTLPNGSIHELILPATNFSIAPMMTFDVAHCQYSTEQDKLEVQYSSNCGQTWNTVYSKAGSVLATKAAQTGAFTPSATQWRKETVNIPASGDLLVKFKATSAYGNNLYLDNINLKACMIQTLQISSSNTAAAICQGDEVVLTASGSGSVQWSNNMTATSISVTPLTNTVYAIVSTDPSGCGNTSSISLNVAPVQTISIAAGSNASGTVTICKGNKVILTASGATAVKWDNNQTTKSITVSPTTNTTYIAVSQDAPGCMDEGAVMVVVNPCTGIAGNNEIGYEVYPNPSKGEFVITGSFGGAQTEMAIFNVAGQKVYTQKLAADVNPVKCNLPAGVYMLQLTQSDRVVSTGKLILE